MRRHPEINILPSIDGRYIVLDTETTGLNIEDDHILEIAAIEIKNGFLTGNQFQGFLKPRNNINLQAQKKHKMNNNFYKENYEDTYESDKAIMQEFVKFLGDSIIFAHNALFDFKFLNNELKFWNLQEIDYKKFRCSMKIFKNLFDNNIFKKNIKGDYLF